MSEVTVAMPRKITAELIEAVKNDPLTQYDDKDRMNLLIGWLVCAYDVMIKERTK